MFHIVVSSLNPLSYILSIKKRHKCNRKRKYIRLKQFLNHWPYKLLNYFVLLKLPCNHTQSAKILSGIPSLRTSPCQRHHFRQNQINAHVLQENRLAILSSQCAGMSKKTGDSQFTPKISMPQIPVLIRQTSADILFPFPVGIPKKYRQC